MLISKLCLRFEACCDRELKNLSLLATVELVFHFQLLVNSYGLG